MNEIIMNYINQVSIELGIDKQKLIDIYKEDFLKLLELAKEDKVLLIE